MYFELVIRCGRLMCNLFFFGEINTHVTVDLVFLIFLMNEIYIIRNVNSKCNL